jgi:hypothetical protein
MREPKYAKEMAEAGDYMGSRTDPAMARPSYGRVVTPWTKVLVDGEIECTWGEFLHSNIDGLSEAEIEDILNTLYRSETYESPAGASACWTVALLTP